MNESSDFLDVEQRDLPFTHKISLNERKSDEFNSVIEGRLSPNDDRFSKIEIFDKM